MKVFLPVLCSLMLFTSLYKKANMNWKPDLMDEMIFENISQPKKQKYAPVYFGDITPGGWLRHQIKKDLTRGFVGKLDELAPEVIQNDDIYGQDRRSNDTTGRDVSPFAQSWWNSESQSNWWDGFIRSALLVADRASVEKVENYVQRILSYQENDGYLGIYAKDKRYDKEGESADFWAQTTLLRGLLAYYEKTKKQEILYSVEKAVQRSMIAYPIGDSTPFKKMDVGHSLIFTDLLDRLYQITRDEHYMAYSVWLYENYNEFRDTDENVLGRDIILDKLLDDNYKFQGHGVHVYELFRALVTAYYASDDTLYKQAIDNYLIKLDSVTTPSGGPIGDEWVFGRNADASETGYEYCSIHELLDSYTFLFQKSGVSEFADRTEWLLYNAGQGARNPNGSGIAYCKTDNSYSMTGPLHDSENKDPDQKRFKYSPAHQEVAVCCAPNAGRVYPYFVNEMWLKTENGVLASLYGPNTLQTKIKGQNLKITQVTKYPFELDVKLNIEIEKPLVFELDLRIPEWADAVIINGSKIAETKYNSGIYSIEKKWNNGDEVDIHFETSVKSKKDLQGDIFYSYGPLAYALSFPETEEITKSYEVPGFHDYSYTPSNSIPTYLAVRNSGFVHQAYEYNEVNPWGTLSLEGEMFNQKTGKKEKVILVPMGGTILRQLTFNPYTETDDIR